MKISEIVSKLGELATSIAGLKADASKVNEKSLNDISVELASIKEGAVAKLEKKNTELATATSEIAALNGKLEKSQSDLTAINTALKSACTALTLEVKENATSLEMVTLIQSGVTATLAKLQIDAAKVPAGIPKTQGGAATTAKKSLDQEIRDRKAQVTATK